MARRRNPRTGRDNAPGKSEQDVTGPDTTRQGAPEADSGETSSLAPEAAPDAPGQDPDRPRDARETPAPDTQAEEAPSGPEADAPATEAAGTQSPDSAPDETAPAPEPTPATDAPATDETGAGQGDAAAADGTQTRAPWGTPATEAPISGAVADATEPPYDAPIAGPDKEHDVTRAAATSEATAQSTAEASATESSGTAAAAMSAAGTARDDTAGPETREHATGAPAVRTEQITVRKGGFWSMLLGGVAAAAIGFAASPYVAPSLMPLVADYLPADAAIAPPEEGDGPAARLDAQAQRIADLETRLDELPAPPDPGAEIARLDETVRSIREQIATLQDRVADLAARPAPQGSETGSGAGVSTQELSGLRDRIAALEDRPAPEAGVSAETLSTRLTGLSEDLAADLDAAVSRLEERLAAQSEDIAALQERRAAEQDAARDSARGTLRRAALTRLQTALDTGAPLAPAIAELRDTGVEVPEALSSVAEDGVPTLGELEADFPDAARAALAAVRAETGDPLASMGDFLRSELGIRSLEPREGDDPDAILSRAEAALGEGRLDAALGEVSALPEVGQAALSDWSARAGARRDALAAADAVSAELN